MDLQYYIQDPISGNFHEISLHEFKFSINLSSEIDTYYTIMIKNQSKAYYVNNIFNMYPNSTNTGSLEFKFAYSQNMTQYSNLTFASSANFDKISPGNIVFLYIKVSKKLPVSSSNIIVATLKHAWYSKYFIDPTDLDIAISNTLIYNNDYYPAFPSNYTPSLDGPSITNYYKLGTYEIKPRPFNTMAADIYLNNESTLEYRAFYPVYVSENFEISTVNVGITPNNKFYIAIQPQIFIFNYTLQVDESHIIGISISNNDLESLTLGILNNFTDISVIIDNNIITEYEVISDAGKLFTYNHEVHIGAILTYVRQFSIPELKKLMEDIKQ